MVIQLLPIEQKCPQVSHSETSNISIQTMESHEHEVVNRECSPRIVDSRSRLLSPQHSFTGKALRSFKSFSPPLTVKLSIVILFETLVTFILLLL